MKKIALIILLSSLTFLQQAFAIRVVLSYDKDTGGPGGTGAANYTCGGGEGNCVETKTCTEGTGTCNQSTSINEPCPTYDSVVARCPGSNTKVWINNFVNSKVNDIWGQIQLGVQSGASIETYDNPTTGESVTVNYTWVKRNAMSEIYDITITHQ